MSAPETPVTELDIRVKTLVERPAQDPAQDEEEAA